MTTSAKPFTISVPDSRLSRLRSKLELTDFPDELSDAGNDYGVPLAEVQRLTKYWLEEFDWRAAEKRLNESMPQFTTPIDVDGFGTLNVHFVHQKSKTEGAIPLLFVHGWPGSFLEVSKILEPLTNPKEAGAPSFHVVAPSLPGYGFSDSAKKRGFAINKYAETVHKVMLSLGYNEYVTQGGDWGWAITRTLSILYPESVKGLHLNLAVAQPPRLFSQPLSWLQHAITPYSAEIKESFKRRELVQQEGMGYFMLQSTRPQTLGYGLTDSPVGLLAWILEKLRDWTEEYPWTPDEILTWVSIYTFSSATPAASLRIYYEHTHTNPPSLPYGRQGIVTTYSPVPLGMSYFPKDLFPTLPSTWGWTLGKVVFDKKHDKGGHFAAWECPELLVQDIREMFGKGGGAGGVVKGKSGF